MTQPTNQDNRSRPGVLKLDCGPSPETMAKFQQEAERIFEHETPDCPGKLIIGLSGSPYHGLQKLQAYCPVCNKSYRR